MPVNTEGFHKRVSQSAGALGVVVGGLPMMNTCCKQDKKPKVVIAMEPTGPGESPSEDPGTTLLGDGETRHSIPEPTSLATSVRFPFRPFQGWGMEYNFRRSNLAPTTSQARIETTPIREHATGRGATDVAGRMLHLDAAEEWSRHCSISSPSQPVLQSPPAQDRGGRAPRSYTGRCHWSGQARGQVGDDAASDPMPSLVPSVNLATVAIRRAPPWGHCALRGRTPFAGELASERGDYRLVDRLLSSRLIFVELGEVAVVSIASIDLRLVRRRTRHRMAVER
jgi:hypothetical protein